MMKIPLIKPYIDSDIKQKVADVLDSGYLTEGPVTKEFERSISDFVGAKYAIAVTSCTTGLELALRALGIGPGDEVIVPDYTYPATASVIPIVGATAVIVDVCKESMLIDYEALEKAITKKTKAIIPVSAFGNPLDYERLNNIKDKYGLYIIEDAAPSLGAEYDNQMVGNLADMTVFSFHPRKFITTGEGGIITTNNKEWAEWMISYKHFGMDMSNTNREGIQFAQIGTNYKLSNILSAVGLGQMEKIDDLLSRRRDLAMRYVEMVSDKKEISLPITTAKGKHSYQSFIIYVDKRNEIMNKLRSEGIEVQIGTYSLHMHNAFNNHPLVRIESKMENSKWCFDHALTLPLFHNLTTQNQDLILQNLLLKLRHDTI